MRLSLCQVGDTVYIVDATDEEIENKVAAQRSKAARSNILRLIPTDIIEEGLELCLQTMAKADAQDPSLARKKLADAFASIGVQPKDIAAYLGHELEQVTPKELEHLRGVYSAIKDGEVSWTEVVGTKADEDEPDKQQQSKTNRTKELLEKRRQEQAKKVAADKPPSNKEPNEETPKEERDEEPPPPTDEDAGQLGLSQKAGF